MCQHDCVLVAMDLIRNDVKNKNGGDSWGTLYGRPMERLAFRYDRHEEIARHIQMWHIYYVPSNGNACVLLTFKNFWLLLLFQTPQSTISYLICFTKCIRI